LSLVREVLSLFSIGGPCPILVLSFWFILIMQHFSLGTGNACLLFHVVSLHSVFSPALASFGLGFQRSGWWRFSGFLFQRVEMDSWNDIQRILRHHEEISHANSSTLQQLSIKFWEFEEALATLSRQMDEIEAEISRLKTLVFPQHSAFASINHDLVSPGDGNIVNGNKDHAIAPMDIENSRLSILSSIGVL